MDIRGANVTLRIGGDGDGGLDEATAAALAGRLHVDVIVHCDDPAVETLLAGMDVTVSVEPASDGGAAVGEGANAAFPTVVEQGVKQCGDREAARDAESNGGVPGSASDGTSGEMAGHNAGDIVGVDTDAFRTAIISMDTTSADAETRFRTAIVAIDGIVGNQVDGISPLYHVSRFDRPDAMAAVIQITTRLDARTLIAALGDVEAAVGGGLDLDLVDMPGVHADDPDCRVPWPSARTRAAVLAPWLDMDPDARLDGDPVSFLLAMAPDAAQVGMLSDNWIIGGTL
ncbi:2-amino-4-hydroxy-6- hydroxymethyldihydropteridine diphosphokinase [Bifidobacterium samirii]|uniref:2-amino-4-hydroxy-6-hydroxymethyldihydropteridine diphosphokinase n=1 Tax=Bifidobacterium samirii TaxID=2306974 RepID=A0A430FWV8_9BIFI|nr:2-amino-4-hydroxy-6- hydroxymethyldihydropteridine diphosphokinase [Bifidobacterium samirii]